MLLPMPFAVKVPVGRGAGIAIPFAKLGIAEALNVSAVAAKIRLRTDVCIMNSPQKIGAEMRSSLSVRGGFSEKQALNWEKICYRSPFIGR
jgi:hypothetical protein